MVEELYTTFRKDLLRYCTAMTQAGAEDLVQETFLRAMAHLDELEDMGRSRQRSWLYKTARNLYIDQMRKQSREVLGGEEPLMAASFEEDFSIHAVAQLVGFLPDMERELFVLRTFAGCNSAELAKRFDLPASTVRSRLASARRHLAKYYDELG